MRNVKIKIKDNTSMPSHKHECWSTIILTFALEGGKEDTSKN